MDVCQTNTEEQRVTIQVEEEMKNMKEFFTYYVCRCSKLYLALVPQAAAFYGRGIIGFSKALHRPARPGRCVEERRAVEDGLECLWGLCDTVVTMCGERDRTLLLTSLARVFLNPLF
eukprot:GHVQ01028116.1.p1 GENE.GHVQ01028116.1~~GHVQ01028116.1.p1  ORF type:complete len:117 (+),score=17.41 GHVQ01028116.1:56-406(+)